MQETPSDVVTDPSSSSTSARTVALRLIPTLVFYAFVCQLQAAVVTVLMFLLSTSRDQFLLVWLAAAVVWLSRHGWASMGWPKSPRRLEGACLVLVAVAVATLLALDRATEAGSFILSIGTWQVAAWLTDSRSRILGRPAWRPGLETLCWVAGAWTLAYVISIQVVIVVGILQLVRNGKMLSRLLRSGGLVPWQVGISFALLGLLGAQIAHTTQSMPSACEPALRDDSTLKVEDNDRFVTIATIGDSSTYGIFLPARLSYPARLQARLREARPDIQLRVINCSFSGATSDHGALQLDDALRYHPRVVTIALGDNDDLGDNDAWAGNDPHGGPRAVSRHLAQNLTELAGRCRTAGVLPMLLTAPAGRMGGGHRMKWVHEPTREVASRESVELVDADLAVRSRPFPSMHFIADFGHPNQWGHDLIATEIARRILPRLEAFAADDSATNSTAERPHSRENSMP